jgi:hypothetical protein
MLRIGWARSVRAGRVAMPLTVDLEEHLGIGP